ncbi:hypothetical protein CA13_50420 [Planctomycetes bacterium CA13]|uniref:Double zinc ribbon n=1 Tax=Novipirellula herctigrandis TaxID=2527986 RepID=A0A5C5Z930_9BACT|nr:hypothetical protein CA13_50420 [Planctomycetes bacterium CA13]
MPIPLKCQCGKTLKIPDNLAGKAVKCPGCASVLKVPASRTAVASQPAQPAVAAPAPNPPGAMDELFEEEGFTQTVEAVCPACRSNMKAGAVLCTKCGYNMETGGRLEAHKTVGVDIGHGTLALEKAAEDMIRTKDTQDRMLSKAGLPWWILALILVLLVGSTLIAVIAINVAKRQDGAGNFNPVATFLALAGGACLTISSGASIMLIVKGFQKDVVTGLLVWLAPFYVFYFVAKNFSDTWRLLLVSLVMGGIGGGLLVAAISSGLSFQ